MRLEIVIIDSQGNVIACLSSFKNFNSQPILAECLALWCMVEFCRELGLQRVDPKCDTQIVIKAINKRSKTSHSTED